MDNSIKSYYQNGKIFSEHWYQNGQLHRLDGPAKIIYSENGKMSSEYWYVDGNQIFPLFDNYPLTKEQQVEMKLTYG